MQLCAPVGSQRVCVFIAAAAAAAAAAECDVPCVTIERSVVRTGSVDRHPVATSSTVDTESRSC